MTATSIRDRIIVSALVVREAEAAQPIETFYILCENGDRILSETLDLLRTE